MKKIFAFNLLLVLGLLNVFASASDAPIVWKYISTTDISKLSITVESDGNQELGGAVFVPAGAYVGDEIRTVEIGFTAPMNNVEIFITKSLSDEPLYSENVGNVTLSGNAEWKSFDLKTPYRIEEDEHLYIGYIGETTQKDFSMGICGTDNKEKSFYFFNGMAWQDLSTQSYPLAIQIGVYGENIQKRSLMLSIKSSLACKPGQDVELPITLFNCGSMAANLLDIEYTVGDEVKTIKNQVVTLHPFVQKTIYVPIDVPTEENVYPLSVKVSKIDVVNPNEYNSVGYGEIVVSNNAKPRMIVCEELTGTACGFCPRGIEGLREMREKYPESFLPIGIHQYSSSDPMYENTYKPFAQVVFGMGKGAPFCMLNRNKESSGDPLNDITELYEKESQKYADMNVKLYVEPLSEGKYKVTTDLDFINTVTANYKIAIVVLEDSVDVDENGNKIKQANSFSGSPFAPGIWGQLETYTDWVYDDVARGIYEYGGMDAMFPATLLRGQIYRYVYELDMPYVLRERKVRIAALIIDSNSGLIENAGVISYDSFGEVPPTVGISEEKAVNDIKVIPVDEGFMLNLAQTAETSVKVYSIDGKLITSSDFGVVDSGIVNVPQNGIFIVRVIQGNVVTDLKVVK